MEIEQHTRNMPSGGVANGDRAYRDEHSWDQLEEDEHGRLRSSVDAFKKKVRRQRLRMNEKQVGQIRRGMIRYLELVIDLSQAASINDMRPVRSAAMFAAASSFIRAFFDENPLSQLGIVVLRDGVAVQVTELSSSPEMHIEKLKANLDTGGTASLGNALDVATDVLRHIPPYGHREILCLLASLSTCDPGDIMSSIDATVKQHIRVSIVGLAAEVYIFKLLAQKSQGTYGVALDQDHMEHLVMEHATPPPSLKGDEAEKLSLVRVGFPSQASSAPGAACFVGSECSLKAGSFICPQCRARTMEVPSECHVCGLTLIASPHLARSYHHLFPVAPFKEIQEAPVQRCFSCCMNLIRPGNRDDETSDISQCTQCMNVFCLDCDEYIHSHVHSCPGCDREM
ncbi:hypothetical protein M9434_001387 [Picochlorum sp. BPE23]|nr:hypothetical protein M9434_001387 [Picochlorum sp. BPE23]